MENGKYKYKVGDTVYVLERDYVENPDDDVIRYTDEMNKYAPKRPGFITELSAKDGILFYKIRFIFLNSDNEPCTDSWYFLENWIIDDSPKNIEERNVILSAFDKAEVDNADSKLILDLSTKYSDDIFVQKMFGFGFLSPESISLFKKALDDGAKVSKIINGSKV